MNVSTLRYQLCINEDLQSPTVTKLIHSILIVREGREFPELPHLTLPYPIPTVTHKSIINNPDRSLSRRLPVALNDVDRHGIRAVQSDRSHRGIEKEQPGRGIETRV